MPKLKNRVELDTAKVVAAYKKYGGVVQTASHFRRRTSVISSILIDAGVPIGTFNDISGKRYGSLTVIERVEPNKKISDTKPYWMCKCDCGKIAIVKGYNLQSGNTRSCGCKQHPKGQLSHAWRTGITDRNKIRRMEYRYNRNKVIDELKKVIIDKYNETRSLEKIGTEFGVGRQTVTKLLKELGIIPTTSGRILSTEHKQKVSIGVRRSSHRFSGHNHYNWKGGITPTYRKIRNGIEYSDWRNHVFERDNYTCVICDTHGCKLEAHHIVNFANNPSMRFNIDNGATMCKDCHDEFHVIFGKRNNNREQLIMFIARKCIVIEDDSNGIIHGTFR